MSNFHGTFVPNVPRFDVHSDNDKFIKKYNQVRI